jgi:hypothetical protein
MKRILIIIAIFLSAAILAAVLMAFNFYRKVLYVPEWYAESRSDSTWTCDTADAVISQKLAALDSSLKNRAVVSVPEKILVPVMVREVNRRSKIDIEKMVRAAKVTVQENLAEVEMVVDVNKLPMEKLPPEAKKAADQIIGMLPQGALNDVYLKVDFSGMKNGGALCLDTHSRVRIGKIEFSVGEIEKITGINSRDVIKALGFNNFSITDSGFVFKR